MQAVILPDIMEGRDLDMRHCRSNSGMVLILKSENLEKKTFRGFKGSFTKMPVKGWAEYLKH